MRASHLLRLVTALALAAVLGPMAASAAPLGQTNLLTNPGFEGGFFAQSGDNSIKVPTGWGAWHEESGTKGTGSLDYVERPTDWLDETDSRQVRSGAHAVHIRKFWDPFHAGIMQTVNVPAGSRVKFSIYTFSFSTGTGFPNGESWKDSRTQIGIDPQGKGLWYDSGVVWSPYYNPRYSASGPAASYQLISLEATVGSAGKVTVFTSSNFRGQSDYAMETWWDDASLVVVTASTAVPGVSATATPVPACQPAPFVMPTAQADGRIIYTVKSCDSLWSIAANVGLTLEQIKAMNNLSSTTVTVGQQIIVGTTTPSNPPTAVPTATLEGQLPPTAVPEATAVANVPPAGVATGSVCVLLYDDANGNGLRDSGEGLVPGGQFTVTNGAGAPVDGYTTSGTETEPRCFDDLVADSYTISVGIPTGYNPTTSTSFPLPLESDSLVNLEFGAQKSASAGSSATGGLSDNGRLRTALFGAAGIVFLLLAAGVGGFLVLSRRR